MRKVRFDMAAAAGEEKKPPEDGVEDRRPSEQTCDRNIGSAGENFRFYSPIAGTNAPLPPGRRMVCPMDPSHYSDYRRELGERLFCPEHQVPLIPALDTEFRIVFAT